MNMNFVEHLNRLECAGIFPLWMPVIELYKSRQSNGQDIYFLDKALWLERRAGEFERRDWDENLGDLIDGSGVYLESKTISAAELFVKSLPHPFLKSMTVNYFPYAPDVFRHFRVYVNVVNSLLKFAHNQKPLDYEGQQFYAM